eukprot:Transcript_7049.p2 GENE.Transcript_7049~~Transcript_7049.p2  ORF type:complete len:184 (-),score=59.12 Transcript_7049:664-1215(-)
MRVLPTVRSSGSTRVGAGAGRARAPRACALPSNAMLYSLLHLGGFAGDVDFYRGRTAGAARILELGSGDGRIGAALCAGAEYVGVERCADFVAAAAERVNGTLLEADMFAPLPEGTPPFDAVVLTANTLFCDPRHAELLARCRDALAPGGALLFDVYNAAPLVERAVPSVRGPRPHLPPPWTV